jgi:hypothetical protein
LSEKCGLDDPSKRDYFKAIWQQNSVHLSPLGRGRIAPLDAIRVRGYYPHERP